METIYILFKNYIISPLNLLIVSIYYVLIDINDKNHNDNICITNNRYQVKSYNDAKTKLCDNYSQSSLFFQHFIFIFKL